MKTEELIRFLAADTVRTPRWRPALIRRLVPALVAVTVVVWAVLGLRADLGTSMVTPVSGLRIVLAGGLGLCALGIAQSLARPEGRQVARLWPLAVIGVAALVLLGAAYVMTPSEVRLMALQGKTLTDCLVIIPVLSILPVAAILSILRQGATTEPALAGFVAGLAGAALAAAAYALHCTEDSPLFYVTWYGTAILGVALLSAALGPRLLRW